MLLRDPKSENFRKCFRIPRRDSEICFVTFVTKFCENWLLRSCRKVVWITRKKLGLRGTRPSPHFAAPIRPKFLERCRPLTCPRIPNLVWIDCALPDLFRKDCIFGPKSIIGFQPTINLGVFTIYKYYISRPHVSPTSRLIKQHKMQLDYYSP